MYVYQYRAYLCKQDKSIIAELAFSDLNYQAFLSEFDELELTIQANENGTSVVQDSRYDLSSGLYLILLEKYTDDTLDSSQYFMIVKNDIGYDSGISRNKISCYSAEYLPMTRRKIRGYNEASATLSQVLGYISATPLYGTWTIGSLPSTLVSEYHVISFEDNSIWDALQSLSNDFDVVFAFDTVNNVISATRRADFTTINGLVLSADNFVNSLAMQPKYDQIVTRLWGFGKNGIGFSRYNKWGTNYIDSLDYPISRGWLSASALGAWNALVAKANGYQSAFDTLVGNIETYQNDLLTLESELAVLETQHAIYETQMAAYKNAYPNETAVPSSAYNTVWNSDQTVLGNITTKQGEITAKEGQITAAEASIAAIAADLAYTSPVNFTTAQLQEITRFIQEDTIQMESLDNEQLLLQYAEQYLARKNVPVVEVDVDVVDLFSVESAYAERSKIQLGAYLYFDIPSIGFNYNTLQLIGWSHNPFDNNLSLKFSNSMRVESDIYYLNEIFKKANATSTKVTNNGTDWSSYVFDRPDLLTNTSVIDAETNQIAAGEITINRWGFRGEDIGAGNRLEYQKDKIIALRNDGENFDTLLSANGLALYNASRTSRTIITPGDAYGKYGGIQIDKWETAATPNDWSGQFWVDLDGTIRTTAKIFVQGDEDTLAIDQYGINPSFMRWFPSLLSHTSAAIAQDPDSVANYWTDEFTPWMWTGCTSSIAAKFMEPRSFRVAVGATMTNVPAFDAAKLNPTWFPTGTTGVRFSWWSKLGQAQVKIKDQTNSNYFSLAQASTPTITAGTYSITFDRNANWEADPDSLWFDITESGHSGCVDIRVEITNVHGSESLYINAPQVTYDRTHSWCQFYLPGPFSDTIGAGKAGSGSGQDPSGGGGQIGNLYVEEDFPSNAPNKAVLVDTNDWSRYDKKDISTATVLVVDDPEYVRCTGSSNYNVTLHTAATTFPVIKYIKNMGTALITVVGTIDGGSNIYLYPGESCLLATNGTNWDQIG